MAFNKVRCITNQRDVRKQSSKKYQISGMEISLKLVRFRVSAGCHQHHHAGECGHMLKRLKNTVRWRLPHQNRMKRNLAQNFHRFIILHSICTVRAEVSFLFFLRRKDE